MDSEIILVHVSIPFALHIDCSPACKQILLRLVGQYDLCVHVCVERKISFVILFKRNTPHTFSHIVSFVVVVPLKVAHDVDGSGNYLLLTHRHVAHLHPFSSYLCRQPCPDPPSWVLYHEFTISRDNCIRIASEVHPQMWVTLWDLSQMVLDVQLNIHLILHRTFFFFFSRRFPCSNTQMTNSSLVLSGHCEAGLHANFITAFFYLVH